MAGGGDDHQAASTVNDDSKDSDSEGDAAEEVCASFYSYAQYFYHESKML